MGKSKKKPGVPMTQTEKKKQEKYFLTEIQKLLIVEKTEKLQLALMTVEKRKQEFSIVVKLCAAELKIPDKNNWELNEGFEYFLKKKALKNK